MNTPLPGPAIVYLRTSHLHQSTDAQRSQCARYALTEGLAVVKTVHSAAASDIDWRQLGFADLHTDYPGLRVLIVHDLARISRNVDDLGDFFIYCHKHSITVHVASTGTVIDAAHWTHMKLEIQSQ
jgi:DNA invertase Pin-like site-specific DNA recombinase